MRLKALWDVRRVRPALYQLVTRLPPGMPGERTRHTCTSIARCGTEAATRVTYAATVFARVNATEPGNDRVQRVQHAIGAHAHRVGGLGISFAHRVQRFWEFRFRIEQVWLVGPAGLAGA